MFVRVNHRRKIAIGCGLEIAFNFFTKIVISIALSVTFAKVFTKTELAAFSG